MTILVDAAIWPWRGRRWAHMVSDTSHDELHHFAVSIGKRRVAFQGDHYDVDEDERLRAIKAGAVSVNARDIVRALRSAGLRVKPGHSEGWQWLAARVQIDHEQHLAEVCAPLGAAGHEAVTLGRALIDELGQVELSAFARPSEVAAMVAVPDESLREAAVGTARAALGPRLPHWFVAGHGPFVAERIQPG